MAWMKTAAIDQAQPQPDIKRLHTLDKLPELFARQQRELIAIHADIHKLDCEFEKLKAEYQGEREAIIERGNACIARATEIQGLITKALGDVSIQATPVPLKWNDGVIK